MLRVFNQFLRINRREIEFSRRGFSCANPLVRYRLEFVGSVFLRGYHAALQAPDLETLRQTLDSTEREYRGFAYEGAAMALTLCDALSPGARRLPRFMDEAGRRHIYMLHVGAGWACARLPWLRWRIESFIRRFHPVLGWLVIDGYGFHQGYFHFRDVLNSGPGNRLSPDAGHVFYQGLGRSLWFVCGCDLHQISQTIAGLPGDVHGDAWSGIGLACAYAGGLALSEIQALQSRAGRYGPHLAQGAAFAAKARQLAGNPAQPTELACKVLCGATAQQAALLCDETLDLVNRNHRSPYQQWRELLQKLLSSRRKLVQGKPDEYILYQHLASSKPN